jgi:hypothetical protein
MKPTYVMVYQEYIKDSMYKLTEITQPCVHMYNGLFICQLYSLPNLLEETDCKEDASDVAFLHRSFPSHS